MSKSAKKYYYGIGTTPKGMRGAGAKRSLTAKQVRRFGEYEVPHKMMDSYLVSHGMKPVWSGSKSAKKPATKKKPVSKRKPAKSKSKKKTSKRGPGRPKGSRNKK